MPNIYDNIKPNKRWRDWRDSTGITRYKYDEEFRFIFLFFDYSKSKNYKKAMRVYKSIPEKYRLELMAHSVQIYYYSDFLKIRKKFTRLLKLVGRWKSTQLWINNQLCTESDFKVFIDIFDSRVRRYGSKHTLPEIEDE